MKYNYIIGLMSGTSLDGVDVVYTKWIDDEFEIIKSETIPYNSYWLDKLKNIANYNRGSVELFKLDIELGSYYGNLLVKFIDKHKIRDIDLIASHGHTVHHQPEIGYTLQIGSGKEIFEKTQIKTVCNFREQDVLYGGQGAPLVPIGDELLFSEYDYCLNLGGFSNVSYSENEVRKAYDICPVNTVLNFYANKLGFEFDKDGELSKKGTINNKLLLELNNLPFYKLVKPKSLGVEFLTTAIYPLMENYKIPEVDLMRTFIEHIAIQITHKIKKGSVLITGGGAYHVFLIDRIKVLNSDLNIVIPSNELVNYKEALIFALLGKLRIEEKINCLKNVTGSYKDHSSGVLYKG